MWKIRASIPRPGVRHALLEVVDPLSTYPRNAPPVQASPKCHRRRPIYGSGHKHIVSCCWLTKSLPPHPHPLLTSAAQSVLRVNHSSQWFCGFRERPRIPCFCIIFCWLKTPLSTTSTPAAVVYTSTLGHMDLSKVHLQVNTTQQESNQFLRTVEETNVDDATGPNICSISKHPKFEWLILPTRPHYY